MNSSSEDYIQISVPSTNYKKNKKWFTYEERKYIESLIKKGYSTPQIAQLTQRALCSIHTEIAIRSANFHDYNAETAHKLFLDAVARTGKIPNEERRKIMAAEIIKLSIEGKSVGSICFHLQVGPSFVRRVLKKYRAQESNSSLEVTEEVKAPAAGNLYEDLDNKIKSLEMQIQILTELIKEKL